MSYNIWAPHFQFASNACLSCKLHSGRKLKTFTSYHVCETVTLVYCTSVAKRILIIQMHKIWSVFLILRKIIKILATMHADVRF